MKLYITEYRTKEGVHKTTQYHTPQPTEHIIGDYIEITRPVEVEGCCHMCGEKRVDFVKYKYEIVEIRQYVRDMQFDPVYNSMWFSILENDRIRYIPFCKLKDSGCNNV